MKEHIHKFKRVILGDTKITIEDGKKYIRKTGEAKIFYRCMVPGCQRMLPKAMMENQISECWRCGEDMIISVLDLYGMGKVHPVHRGCRRSRNRSLDELSSTVD